MKRQSIIRAFFGNVIRLKFKRAFQLITISKLRLIYDNPRGLFKKDYEFKNNLHVYLSSICGTPDFKIERHRDDIISAYSLWVALTHRNVSIIMNDVEQEKFNMLCGIMLALYCKLPKPVQTHFGRITINEYGMKFENGSTFINGFEASYNSHIVMRIVERKTMKKIQVINELLRDYFSTGATDETVGNL